MTAVEILKAARALLADPARWTKGASARNSYGAPVYPGSSAAESFCALGAIGAVDSDSASAAVALLETYVHDYLVAWNDKPLRTHAEVLAAFDRAIA